MAYLTPSAPLLRRTEASSSSSRSYVDDFTPDQLNLLVTHGILSIIALLIVGGRTYVRAVRLKAFRTDDRLMLLAQLFNLFSLVCLTQSVRWGNGKEYRFIQTWVPLLRWNYAFNLLAMLALSFAKMSIVYHLLRFFEGRSARRFLYSMLGILIITTLWALVFLLCQCFPLSAVWDYTLRAPTGTAKCIPDNAFIHVTQTIAAIVIATDIALAIMPVPLVWSLHLKLRVKIMLVCVLGMGALACFAGIVKIYHNVHIFDTNNHKHLINYLIWLIVEFNVAIIAASLPTIKPLLTFLFPSSFRPSSSNYNLNHNHNNNNNKPRSAALRRDRPKELVSPFDIPVHERSVAGTGLATVGSDTTLLSRSDLGSPGGFEVEKERERERERRWVGAGAGPLKGNPVRGAGAYGGTAADAGKGMSVVQEEVEEMDEGESGEKGHRSWLNVDEEKGEAVGRAF